MLHTPDSAKRGTANAETHHATADDGSADKTPADYDGAWKNALDTYFPEFLALLYPELHTQIDWRCKPVFLDKELQRLGVPNPHGRRHVDKLVRLRLRGRKRGFLLIHVDAQGPKSQDLPVRMYVYHHRIWHKHPRDELHSLAVLTHSRHGSDTQTYTHGRPGTAVSFIYSAIHLESWRPRMKELLALAPANSFAVVVLAQLEANARHPDDHQFDRKVALVALLYNCGYSQNDIVQLFNILDAMLVLPTHLEANFVEAVIQIEEEHKVTYINTVERVLLRREHEKGIAHTLASLLTRKFGTLPDWAKTRLVEADQVDLERWTAQILDAQRIEDVFE